MDEFAQQLLHWHDQNGRHSLPWKHPATAYRIWISEIMLQQTQVATVQNYFLRFIDRFPDIQTLAAASIDDVLSSWSGLGYYARARHLHRTAKIICDDFTGEFPQDFQAVLALPGIGRSTAGAILAQAFGKRFPILDGNVKRVLSRVHGIREPLQNAATEGQLWELADTHTPNERIADYTQAIMDLGAMVCTRSAACGICPVQPLCEAYKQGVVALIPMRRAKAAIPTRQTRMLLIEREDRAVLLYQRPPSGLWGGLWSLPELPVSERQNTVVIPGLIEVVEKCDWGKLHHRFTHFHLQIVVELWQVRAADGVMEESAGVWYHPKALATVGLAAPIQKILALRMNER